MKIGRLTALGIGIALLAFLVAGTAIPQSNQDITVSGSYKDIYYRLDKLDSRLDALEAKIGDLGKISKLESEIAELQKRVKELESKSKVLTIPQSQITPGTQMPPGSKPHEFNGMQFWTIPLGNK